MLSNRHEQEQAIRKIAQYLATDEGKAQYRQTYNDELAAWIDEFSRQGDDAQTARYQARGNAVASAMDDVSYFAGNAGGDIDFYDWQCNRIDARIWARCKDADKIEERLRAVVFR